MYFHLDIFSDKLHLHDVSSHTSSSTFKHVLRMAVWKFLTLRCGALLPTFRANAHLALLPVPVWYFIVSSGSSLLLQGFLLNPLWYCRRMAMAGSLPLRMVSSLSESRFYSMSRYVPLITSFMSDKAVQVLGISSLPTAASPLQLLGRLTLAVLISHCLLSLSRPTSNPSPLPLSVG